MTTPSGRRPKHLASSPFKPAVEPVVEVFEVGDHVDAHAVTADFGSKTVRIAHPYPKLHHL